MCLASAHFTEYSPSLSLGCLVVKTWSALWDKKDRFANYRTKWASEVFHPDSSFRVDLFVISRPADSVRLSWITGSYLSGWQHLFQRHVTCDLFPSLFMATCPLTHHTRLYFTSLHCTSLHCTLLHFTALPLHIRAPLALASPLTPSLARWSHATTQHLPPIVLLCTVLYYTVLYCTVLYSLHTGYNACVCTHMRTL